MAALEMTFTCDNPNCTTEQTVSADGDHVIKEDLEGLLIEDGWWHVRNWAWDHVYCGQGCLESDLSR